MKPRVEKDPLLKAQKGRAAFKEKLLASYNQRNLIAKRKQQKLIEKQK